MPIILLACTVAVVWVIWPMLRKTSVQNRWIILLGGGMATLFLLKGKAVLSASAALAALAMKLFHNPLFRPLLKTLFLVMPGIAGANARQTRRRAKEDKQVKDAASLLNIPQDAAPDVIHRAYVAYMKMNHPDKGGTEEAAKRGGQARDVLLKRRDAEKNTPS